MYRAGSSLTLRAVVHAALYCGAALQLGSSAMAAAPAAQPVTSAEAAVRTRQETSELQAQQALRRALPTVIRTSAACGKARS